MSEHGTIELSDVKPIWCKGCGNYSVLHCLRDALNAIGASPESTVVTSGIGCSSRLPGYLNCFGFNGIHGRSLPLSVGVKLKNPGLTVVSVGGDGDSLGIGLGHLAHTARKNIDLTHLIFDNRVYGLTKGQTSPTTPLDTITITHPYGNIDSPINAVAYATVFGATFVARTGALDRKKTTEMIERAMRHKGFSVVHIITPCVTFRFREEIEFLKSHTAWLDSDGYSVEEAIRLSSEADPFMLGVFREVDGPDYVEAIRETDEMAGHLGKIDIQSLIQELTPA